MTERLGDAPIESDYRELMNKIAATLDKLLNGELKGHDRKNGFVLIVFPFDEVDKPRSFGTAARANYISNASRADVVTMLKEQVRRFEGAPDVTGHA